MVAAPARFASLLALMALGACGGSTATPMAGAGGLGAGSGGAAATAGGTGTAGSIGVGGAGGCTITATSALSSAIPTVGIVTFTTDLAGIGSAEIRFGLASTGPTMTAPVDLAQPDHRTLLLGMKGSSSYVFQIVANSGAGTCSSPSYTITTGAVPAGVPTLNPTITNAAAHARGFMITSAGTRGTGAWIFDSDGAPVWWATGPSQTSRIEMSWDGRRMYMMALNVMNQDVGSVAIIGMDGTGRTTADGMIKSHHDLTAIPGGFATLLWNTTGTDAHCSLVERADDGTLKTVVADMNSLYTAPNDKFHTNSIHYYPSDDTYTLGDRNPNLYVKVSRTGGLIWQLGGDNPKDPARFFSGAGSWMVNHGHHMLADGTFLLFNNGKSTTPLVAPASSVLGFKLDESRLTATSAFTYMNNLSSTVLGDVQVLPNGNVLVTASYTGQIIELTPTAQVVATFKTASLGYTEYRDSLYGAPPR